MGDFNPKIGLGNKNYFGQITHGNRNKKGKNLINFAISNNLIICNTLFQKKPSRK